MIISIAKKDKEKFLNIIRDIDNKMLNKYTKQTIKKILNSNSYIINAFDYEYLTKLLMEQIMFEIIDSLHI